MERLQRLKGCSAVGLPQGWMQAWAWGCLPQQPAWPGALPARLLGWVEGWPQASVWELKAPGVQLLQPLGLLHWHAVQSELLRLCAQQSESRPLT